MKNSEQEPPPTELRTPSLNGKTVLVFFVVTFVLHAVFCFWLSYNERSWLRDPQFKTVRDVRYLARRLENSHKTNGCFPDRLEALFADQDDLDYVKSELSDGWKRPLNFVSDGKTWQISSNGSDGQPGGVGVETDMWFTEASFAKGWNQGVYETTPPTLKQIFVKDFVNDVLFSSVLFLIYSCIPSFFYWRWVVRKQTPYICVVVLLVFWVYLNYMVALIAMIPAARK
jgi:hypothetical protein